MDYLGGYCSSVSRVKKARRIGTGLVRIFDHDGESKGHVVLFGIASQHRDARKLECTDGNRISLDRCVCSQRGVRSLRLRGAKGTESHY